MKRKILHVLAMPLQVVKNMLGDIKNAGFTAIQLSPVQPCKKMWKEDTEKLYTEEWWNINYKEWWTLYQPTDFTIGNRLGSKQDLIELVNSAHDYGIEVYVDVVLRHLANETAWNTWYKGNNIELKQFLLPEQFEITDYNNAYQVAYGATCCLVLDYNSPELIERFYRPFLTELLDICDGIRLDQAMHYELHSRFWTSLIAGLPQSKFKYGECIHSTEEVCKEMSKYMLPLCSIFENWNVTNSVRFGESHDSYLSFLSSVHWNDETRLNHYETATKFFTNSIYFMRRQDTTALCSRMYNINHMYN